MTFEEWWESKGPRPNEGYTSQEKQMARYWSTEAWDARQEEINILINRMKALDYILELKDREIEDIKRKLGI